MPMYDTSYVAPPTAHQIACSEMQAQYAAYIERERLFEDLEAQEKQLAEAFTVTEGLHAAGMVSEQTYTETIAHLTQARETLKTGRLIIEQLDRASKGEAYGDGLKPAN